MKRTKFDDDFETGLDEIRDKLGDFFDMAVTLGHPDIQSNCCYLMEIIDTIMSNRTEE